MNKIKNTKTAVRLIVGIGASTIINNIVKSTSATDTVFQKITITSGSWVLGAIVADAAGKYTDAAIDDIVAWWKETKYTIDANRK